MKTFVRGLVGKEDLNIGSGTFTRTTSSGGSQTMTKMNMNPQSIVFADQMTGSDASAKIQAAINFIAALGAGGGTVDARNLSDSGGTGSTIIDPGTQCITLLLGPYTYNFSQIKLQSNLRVIGSGLGNNATSTFTTIIQTTDSTKDAFILGSQPTQGVLLEGFRLRAVAGNTTQKGLNITGAAAGGLWYSSFKNLQIGRDATNNDHFRGGNMYFSAPFANTASVNQFLDFTNVSSFRNSSTGNCLDILGQNGQFEFNQCYFEGSAKNDGGILINMADDNTSFPYSILFNVVTLQKSTIGVKVRGSWSITFNVCHIENMGGSGAGGTFNLAAGANNNLGFTIQNCVFQTSGSVTGGGSAYYVQDSSLNGESITFCNNFMSEAATNWPSQMNGFGNTQGLIPYAAANRIPNTTQNVQSFTSSGTFTVPNGVSSVKVRVIGGGGGGAGSSSTINGGGGAAGGYSEGFLTNLAPVTSGIVGQGTTITVTIGTGGTGGAASNAGAAGTGSSVAALSPASLFTTIATNGGGGGFSSGASSSGGVGAALGSGGSVNEGGDSGGIGTGGLGGQGGGSQFGGGAPSSGAGGNAGNPGRSHGAGGSGGSAGGSGAAGGNGLSGIVIFEWVN